MRLIFFTGYDKDKLKKEGDSLFCQSHDIGLGGICIDLAEKPRIGQFVQIRLTLPLYNDTHILQILTQILWAHLDEETKLYKTGFHFIDLDDINAIKLA